MAAKNDKEKKASVTYLSKELIQCPVCDAKFHREEMASGGGRLIAGELTDELRRLYEPSVKYGEVFPQIYNITVCPSCLYAALPSDFGDLTKSIKESLESSFDVRLKALQQLFPIVNFKESRGLIEGAASYYLAMLCYDHADVKKSPTIKQAICAMRAAWMFAELDKKLPGEHYDYVKMLFYKKALFLYKQAIDLEQHGKETIAAVKSFGPDTDKNYGYDGVLYLSGLLEYKYGQHEDLEKRKATLEESKRAIAKIFGLGRSSKSKPGPLLEIARTLFENIRTELDDDEEGDEDE